MHEDAKGCKACNSGGKGVRGVRNIHLCKLGGVRGCRGCKVVLGGAAAPSHECMYLPRETAMRPAATRYLRALPSSAERE